MQVWGLWPGTALLRKPYFARNGDLCKIGITENLLRRLGELQPDEVLNIVRCRNYQDVERKLHLEFKAWGCPGFVDRSIGVTP